MANPNLQLLTDAAKLLEPILGELVFAGGCATALLITDKAIDSSGEIIVPTLSWLAASGGTWPGRASLNSRIKTNFLISFTM